MVFTTGHAMASESEWFVSLVQVISLYYQQDENYSPINFIGLTSDMPETALKSYTLTELGTNT